MTELLTEPREETADAVIRFHAQGVTGHEGIEVSFQRSTPADAVAQSLAEMLGMPSDVPWAIRNDQSSAYLVDGPIGSQLEPNARVTVTPKTHLGAR